MVVVAICYTDNIFIKDNVYGNYANPVCIDDASVSRSACFT